MDGRGDPDIAVRSMPEMLYDVIRCTAVHEAKLPDNLRITDAPVMKTGINGELVLPIDVIFGLLMAVVASPVNAGEIAKSNPTFSVAGKSCRLNDIWGKRDEFVKFLGI